MNPLKISLKILNVLLSVASIIVIYFIYSDLPDLVPTHYNYNGEVTSWGKKSELLVLPWITLLIGLPMVFLSKLVVLTGGETLKKDKKIKDKVEISTDFMVATILLMIISITAELYISPFTANGAHDSSLSPISVMLFCCCLGLCWIACGYLTRYMPQSEFNLNPKVDPVVYAQRQQLSFKAMGITGILTIVTSIIFPNLISALISCGYISIAAIYILIQDQRNQIAFEKSKKSPSSATNTTPTSSQETPQ